MGLQPWSDGPGVMPPKTGRAGTPGAQVVDELTPEPHDLVERADEFCRAQLLRQLRRAKILPNQSLRRGRLFQLRNHDCSIAVPGTERPPKPSRHMLFRLQLQFAEVRRPPGLRHPRTGSCDNLIEKGQHDGFLIIREAKHLDPAAGSAGVLKGWALVGGENDQRPSTAVF